MKLSLASAAENVAQLVADELLDVGAGGLEILARVELVGMLVEELTDGAGHGKTQVGVDVDLADGELCSLTQLILGNADSVGHLAAVFVDDLHEALGNGRSAVQNDREAGQTAGDLFEDVKAQGRRNENTVYGRSQSAFSEGGLAVGASMEDLGKGLRSQVGTMFATKSKGPRYLEMAEGYCTKLALNKDDEIIGYEFINFGKMMDFIKAGIEPAEAMKKAQGHYGQWDNAAKYIDPRKD